MKTEYSRITFASTQRVGNLPPLSGFGADGGRTITRVTADGRDDVHLTMPGQPLVVIPWHRVASAIPAPTKAEKTSK